MTWIRTIPYQEASGRPKKLYDRIKGPGNTVDNILMSHRLRPHTLEGHIVLYKHVLHDSGNMVPAWFLETIGVWVSLINGCGYCVDQPFAGLKRLLSDDARTAEIRSALDRRDPDAGPFSDREKAALHYARVLTENPPGVAEAMVGEMRLLGYDDGEILEVNQAAAYFSYANRTVLGLGCSTDGDILGRSPNNSDDSDGWSHT